MGESPLKPESSFNIAFLKENRPERLFAFHLGRLGIQRLLDIGSNTGQFALKMRSLGYRGFIYSVEPQSAAHAKLLAYSRADARWLSLPCQGVAAEKGFFDLNLSENGWSSSLLEVHPNHIRAESTTRIIGKERIFVSKTSDLLRAEYMTGFEALKINVQGYEAKVIEGYLPFMANVRLLLLELSMVECYRGAPDLFALDALLVGRLGFSRVAFEPSFYDDANGIAQQYDGIYFKPDQTARNANTTGVTVSAVVTSIGGALERRSADGSNVGGDWLAFCVRSWKRLAPRVISVSESPPPIGGIQWIEIPMRPSLAHLFHTMEQETDQHVLLTNSDIAITQEMARLIPELDPIAIYYGNRMDVEMHPNKPGTIVGKKLYLWGFDYFLLPPAFVRLVNHEGLLPDTFRLGEPWWDYLLPVIALARGFPIKRLVLPAAIALHYVHHARYSKDRWVENGQRFLQSTMKLLESPGCHAEGQLREILATVTAEDIEQSLHRVSRVICDTLP